MSSTLLQFNNTPFKKKLQDQPEIVESEMVESEIVESEVVECKGCLI